MVKKPSLSIHIELYIIKTFPKQQLLKNFLLFLSSHKCYLPWFKSPWVQKEKDLDLKKEKFFGPEEKKSDHTPMVNHLHKKTYFNRPLHVQNNGQMVIYFIALDF